MKKRVNDMVRLYTLSSFKKVIGYAVKKVANPPAGGLATLLFKNVSLFQLHIRNNRFYLFIQLFIHRIKFSRAV
jgi:hypothetical protein